MRDLPINYLAVLVAAVVKVIIGALWFSPFLFQKAWNEVAGFTPEEMKKRTPVGVAVELVAALVMSWILAHAIGYAGAKGVVGGLMVGFFNWLGFVLAIQLPTLVWDKRPAKVFAISQAYLLIAFLVMGAIIAAWA